MSYGTREAILIALNALIGVWYTILSTCFLVVFAQIQRALAADHEASEASAPGSFPAWWVKHSKWIIRCGFIGTTMFLAGCGFHHFHLAFEIVPQTVKVSKEFGVPLSQNLWVGNHFIHHAILMGAQAIGAPLLLFAGAASWIALRQRAKV